MFTGGYGGLKSSIIPTADWKRDALLFDRVYASCRDPLHPPDIPLEVSFGIAQVDNEILVYENTMAQMVAEAYATSNPEEIAKMTSPSEAKFFVEACDFDRKLSSQYSEVGIMGQWAYSSRGVYLRRFEEGERVAYEGALNNLPLVSGKEVSWDQVLEFRNDQEAVRKYRDLRLWLQAGLKAQTVEHATDLIGQKIENYRWAIKKHGLKTFTGTIAQLFEWKESRLTLAAAAIAGTFGGPVWAGIAMGLTIMAEIGTSLCERKVDKDEILRGPDHEIAILFEAQERFGS